MTVSEIGWFTAGFYGSGFFERDTRSSPQATNCRSERKIKSLSKGMRAKVSLSLALAHEPELLILDEPTSGLDTLVRREFLEGMVDIAAAGRTVLLSSHQIGEVERVADIIAIIRPGKLLLVERLETLKDQIRELNFTLAEAAGPAPRFLAKSSASAASRNNGKCSVRLSPPLPLGEGRGEGTESDSQLDEAQLETLRAHPGVEELRIRTPSLEEIFVAYLKLAEPAAEPSPARERTRVPN